MGVPAEVGKVVAGIHTLLLLNMFISCMVAGDRRKAIMALNPKGKGDLYTLLAFRPFCMLDTAGSLKRSS